MNRMLQKSKIIFEEVFLNSYDQEFGYGLPITKKKQNYLNKNTKLIVNKNLNGIILS